MNNANEQRGPLAGLLVLDFTTVVSGPVCTQLLHDNGARVIKVERPGTGDSIRACEPKVDGDLFTDIAALNGGKESIEADLKNPEDAALLKRIIKKADILVENFRPGVMQRAGLDYDSVKDLNPALIYGSISGYGQTGPRHQDPAYDEIIQAASGLMSLTGPPEGPSLIAGASVADCISGLTCFAGIMTACVGLAKTGKGCHVDTAMIESLLLLLSEPVAGYSATGQVAPKLGNDHPSITPFSSYATGGLEIVICVASPALWQKLCKALGKEEWLEKPEFAFPATLHDNKDLFRKALETLLKTQDHQYWIEKLESAGVPVSLVNSIKDTCNMEQLKARGFFVKTAGHWYNGNPIVLSTYPRITERPTAQQLGESNEKVKKEFAG